MIPISISLEDVAEEFNLGLIETQGLMEYVVKGMTLKLAKAWDTQAKISLNQSREQYRRSLIVVDKGRFEGLVILKGSLPNMIESGVTAFDMKIGFSRSHKAKTSKDGGWYLTIPFRYATPGALGENSVFSGVLPVEIYAIVKNKKKALQNAAIPAPFNQPTLRPQVTIKNKVFEEYKSKTSIYAGLQASKNMYGQVIQGQYNTFRRVSDKSDANMFIHTGIAAHNLAEKAVNATNIPLEVDKLTDNYLSQLGF